jgi:hypothetical protein
MTLVLQPICGEYGLDTQLVQCEEIRVLALDMQSTYAE